MKQNQDAMITTHILKMKCGVTCTMSFDEKTLHYDCEWSHWPISTLPTVGLRSYWPHSA